jgi:hypothetical protein
LMISMLPIVSISMSSIVEEPSAVVKGILHNNLFFLGTILSSRTNAANANSYSKRLVAYTRQEFYY